MNLLQQLDEFNTAEISDALDACGVEGALLRIHALSPGKKLIGPAYTIRYLPYNKKPATFQGAANYIDQVPAHSVIVIDNDGREDCTVWGDILTRVSMKKEIAGTVIYGAVRDIAAIAQTKYPVFCSSHYMRSGKNRVYKADEQCLLTIQGVTIHPGDIIFADDNGVLVIPISLITDVINKAKNIKSTEKKIMAAIESGVPLAQARKDYHYDEPWLTQDGQL